MLEFVKKHKVGIIITLLFHFLLFGFTMTKKMNIPPYVKKTQAIIEFDFREDPIIEDEIVEEDPLEEAELPTEEAINERIQNMMRDANDKRKRSNKNYSEKQIEEQLEQKYKNLEQEIIAKRKAEGKGFDPSKYEFTPKESDNGDEKASSAEAENQKAGRVASTCNIPGRDCRSKTPAYRCQTSGKVFIEIKVNQKGVVTSAKVNPSKSTTSNDCLVQESIKYAKRTRVNQDFKGPRSVDGTVEFNFISQ